MQTTFRYRNQSYSIDWSKPLDISIPISTDQPQVNCFYAPQVQITPYISGDFIGSIQAGAPVNFMNIQLNPHGNGTHTECLAHICDADWSINKALTQFHFVARLITIDLNEKNAIELKHLEEWDINQEALIIRTIPNEASKKTKNYSGSNPPFITEDAMKHLVNQGVQHLLVDIPSVDPEVDGGKLLAHKAFWQVAENPRKNCTITELIYVSNEIPDDLYVVNLQIISLEMDASPSKPVLYSMVRKD